MTNVIQFKPRQKPPVVKSIDDVVDPSTIKKMHGFEYIITLDDKPCLVFNVDTPNGYRVVSNVNSISRFDKEMAMEKAAKLRKSTWRNYKAVKISDWLNKMTLEGNNDVR